MNCIINILDKFLPNVTPGGQWELVGFSLTESGVYGSGGNWPWSTNTNDNVTVDFTDIIQGYYKLNYFIIGPCGGLQEVIIPVIGGGDAGITKTIELCTTNSPINIAQELLAEYDTGVLQASYTFTGNGVTSSAYIANDSNTPLDDVFDPTLVGVGSYQITLSITPQSPTGYALDSCDDCLPSTATLFINISNDSINISIANCWISIDNQSGCDNATFELYKDLGAGFVATGITTFPYQVTEDADWKIVGSNCDCGTLDSNIVNSLGCCQNGTLQIYTDPGLCLVALNGNFGCSGGTFEWWRSCDNQVTWQPYPAGNTDLIFVTDDCCYQLIKTCPNGCRDISNVVCMSGCVGTCNGSLAIQSGTCTYTVVGGPTCSTTGTVNLEKNVGGSWIIDQSIAYTGYPQTFIISSDGDYRATVDCDNDNCPPYVGSSVTFTGCGPSCTSTLSTTVNNCLISANVTNCPSPIYTFLDNANNVLQTGTSSTYIASTNGTYIIEVSGCPSCPILSNTVTVTNCNVACNSVLTLVDSDCTVIASVTNCPNPTYIFKIGGVTVQSGSSDTYAHNLPGNYIVDVEVSGCPNCTILTGVILMMCSAGCNCSTTLSETNCVISATDVDCSGYSDSWRWFDVDNNIWVTKGSGSSITADENGLWERLLTKANCPTISEQITISCVPSPCTLSLDAYYIDSVDCKRVHYEYSGSPNITIIFSYPTVNVTDCNNAGGWVNFVPTGGSTYTNNNGTGGGDFIAQPPHLNTCIRTVIIDNDNPSCPVAQGYLLVEDCCTDQPSLSSTFINDTYTLRVKHPDNTSSQMKLIEGDSSSEWKWQMEEEVRLNGSVIVSNLQETDNFCIYSGSTRADIVGPVSMDIINQGTQTITTINLNPSTSTNLSGPYGTVTATDLDLTVSSNAVWINAMEIFIRNSLDDIGLSQGTDYDLQVIIGKDAFNPSNDKPMILMKCDRDSNWYELHRFGWNQITGPTVNVPKEFWQEDLVPFQFSGYYETPCGDELIKNVTSTQSSGFFIWPSGNAAVYLDLANTPLVSTLIIPESGNTNGSGSVTTICYGSTLVIDNECVGATYLWSTGATTESIDIYGSGPWSVVITCPDGCEYTLYHFLV